MAETTREQPKGFFDVFISYRHRDADRIDELERKIGEHGFTAFRDLHFPEFRDTNDVTRCKIEEIRRILLRATCLVCAFSRASADADEANPDVSVGVWMP